MTENLFRDEVVANQFNDYNDVLEQVLGYNFVMSTLKSTRAKKILDYGCGLGKVSLRLANQLSADIVAVDESAKMIEIAKRERRHQQIDYKIVKTDNLDFISDNSVDGAIACYVFINNQSEQRILKIMREIYRTLRPNSHFIILDTNPNTTGVPFSTFQNGEPGKSYSYGEERVEKLNLDSQEKLILHDFNWPNRMYETNLKRAGFSEITVRYPKLEDFSAEQIQQIEQEYHYKNWLNEKTQAPFILYQAIKK